MPATRRSGGAVDKAGGHGHTCFVRVDGVTKRATLPLYRLTELEAAKAAFWQALATELGRAGCRNVPQALETTPSSVPAAIGPDLLFTQLCGYPMLTRFSTQVRVLAAPVYDASGCEGATHCGVFVVARTSPFSELSDLRGGRFVFGGPLSNSGMNLPRRALADIARSGAFFSRVTETDSQTANLEAVATGHAEATCVDNLTLAYVAAHRPQLSGALRILAETPRSPCIPFVTSASTDEDVVGDLREALAAVAGSPEWSEARRGLMLADIVPADRADYEPLLEYERAAAALGYPEIR